MTSNNGVVSRNLVRLAGDFLIGPTDSFVPWDVSTRRVADLAHQMEFWRVYDREKARLEARRQKQPPERRQAVRRGHRRRRPRRPLMPQPKRAGRAVLLQCRDEPHAAAVAATARCRATRPLVRGCLKPRFMRRGGASRACSGDRHEPWLERLRLRLVPHIRKARRAERLKSCPKWLSDCPRTESGDCPNLR